MSGMSAESPYSAVIFDMDGVLCDSEQFICEAGRLMFERHHGIAVTHDDFKPFTGTGEDRFLGGVALRRMSQVSNDLWAQ